MKQQYLPTLALSKSGHRSGQTAHSQPAFAGSLFSAFKNTTVPLHLQGDGPFQSARCVVNITVYLGANAGNDPALAEAVRELGSWIGANGHRLVYGGSRSGLMGQLAQRALDAGGTVTGVEPQFFVQQELQHDGLTELIVTKDMTERKTKMIELGDAFIAFPGGTGTLEEIAEVMSKVSLGQLDAPCILYDLNGYYDSLKALLAKMIEKGLSTPQRQQGIRFAANLEEITTILNKA